MINYRLTIILATVIFIFLSCRPERVPIQADIDAQTFETDRLMVDKSSYQIQLDNFLSFGFESTVALRTIEGTKYLVFSNMSYNSIDIYELGYSEMVSRIKLDEIAEEKIIKFTGSYLFNLDSILIVNSLVPNASFSIDGAGKYLSSIPAQGMLSLPSYINVVQFSSVPFVKHKDWLYFCSWESSLNGSKILDPKYNFAWRMNLTNSNVEKLPILYPKGYITEDIDAYAALDISCSRMEEKIIYSFPQSDTIRIYDMNSESVTSNIMKGNFNVTPPYPKLSKGDYSKSSQSILNESLFYDHKKQIFYLVRLMPIEKNVDLEQGEDLSSSVILRKPLTIEILDMNFNYIDHISLPGNEYSALKIFVDDGLLYISKNHPYSRTLSEDILTFEVFNIEIKE